MCLLLYERQLIAEEYDITISEIRDCIECYNCFPLLCKSFENEDTTDTKAFFNHPFKVFEKQLKMLDTGQLCALLTLLMFNGEVQEVMITGDIQPAVKDVIENTCNACNLNAQNSFMTIHKELENFIDTYVVKTGGVYHVLNESIFNVLLHYFGQLMTELLIMYACTSFVKERFQLSVPSTNKDDYQVGLYVNSEQKTNTLLSHVLWDKIGFNAVILRSDEYRKKYIKRMVDDWSKGYVKDVFENPNIYHFCFFKYIDSIVGNDLGHLMKKTDIVNGSTPMIVHCNFFYFVNSPNCYDAVLLWLINNGCPINGANNNGETAVFCAARNGNFHMIQVLVDNKADCNICEIKNGHSPLFVACVKGYKGIAKLLLQSGANCNVISMEGNTPLHAACCNGHTSIVTELLTRDADLGKTNNNGETPLDMARLYGRRHTLSTIIGSHIEIELD
ncbi:serine/threonine-protein phosphatase 6 regulatory ankyrin repeat subunit B-like [Mytilus trossulus]|uniref:serine/threonine-protein phosphatase 6 regulatory ankyrin repeat subunit B-like n=1 Tax=Mytilus trossulus TaxID=6551 RepID=UPI003005CB82